MFGKMVRVLFALAVPAACTFGVLKIAQDFDVWVAVEAALILVTSYAVFSAISPPRHGTIIVNILGGHREVGPGIHFLLRPFEWVDQHIELEKFETRFAAHPDTKNRDVIQMWVTVGCEVCVPYLFEYSRFSSAQREDAIQKRIEGLLTRVIFHYDDLAGMYAESDQISAKLMLLFHSGEASGISSDHYYGLKVNYIFLSDIALSQSVQEAAGLKRIAEEKIKALVIDMNGYYQEMDRLIAKNPRMSKNKALEILLAKTGSIPQSTINYRYEAGPDLTGVLKKFGKLLTGDKS